MKHGYLIAFAFLITGILLIFNGVNTGSIILSDELLIAFLFLFIGIIIMKFARKKKNG